MPLAHDDLAGEPEPEGESTRGEMREGGRRLAIDDGRARLDGDDAIGDLDLGGMGGDEGREHDGLGAGGLADPGRAVAAGLRLAGDGGELGQRHDQRGQGDVGRHGALS